MAEALGIASSITALIEASTAVIGYLKAVKDAPKERKTLLAEISDLKDSLLKVKPLTAPLSVPPFTVPLIVPLTLTLSLTTPALADDPWLVTMQTLLKPFARLTVLLNDLQKKLEPASSGRKRLLWKLEKESVEDALKEIERIKSLMIVAVQRDHVALSHAIQEKLAIIDTKVDRVLHSTNRIEQVIEHVDTNIINVSGQVVHIKDGVSQIQSQGQKAQDDDMLMRIIAWLTDLNFKSVQAEKLSQRVGNTGRWFLESKLFKEWVDGMAPSLCLWCPGNPGVGKTILTAIVIDYLRLLNHERKTLVLSIFCDYQSATAQTIPNLLCSLLKQLVQDNGLLNPITLLYNQCHRDGTRPSLDVLTKILLQEFKSFHRVYIVLDALDEFTGGKLEEQMNKQEELIRITKLLGNNIHLLVTSRDITWIGLLFKADTRLDIRAAEDDINSYIMSKLSCGRLASLIKGQDDLRQEILNGVTEKADGMFLLVSLHMELLAQTTTHSELRVAVRKLPYNMQSAYNKTLEIRVDSQGEYDKKLAYRIFGWIAFTRRPLTVLELQHALAVKLDMTTLDPDNLCDKDLLESVCAGLVLVDLPEWHEDPIVKFVHYTTQEYFLSRQEELFPHFEETIMDTCLTYMSFNNFGHLLDDGVDDNECARDNVRDRGTYTLFLPNSDSDSMPTLQTVSSSSSSDPDSDPDSDSDSVPVPVPVPVSDPVPNWGWDHQDWDLDFDDKSNNGNVHHWHDLVVKHPFLHYSSVHWGYHARNLQHSMETKITTFLDSAYCRKVASIFHHDSAYHRKHTSISHCQTTSSKTPIPLQFALDYGLLHIMEVLLNGGADPCQCKKPLLIFAIQRQNLEMVRMLLDRDKIDQIDPDI